MMTHIITLSDLHGYLPTDIPTCDVVVIAGDIVPLCFQNDDNMAYDWLVNDLNLWCEELPTKKVIITPGNHDFIFQNKTNIKFQSDKIVVLINQEYTFNDLKFFGTPYTEISTKWAFSKRKYYTYNKMIPKDTDVLICHQPPKYKGIGTVNYIPNLKVSKYKQYTKINIGSQELFNTIKKIQPKLVVCGHIHTGNHDQVIWNNTTIINAAIKDDNYDVAYPYQEIVLE